MEKIMKFSAALCVSLMAAAVLSCNPDNPETPGTEDAAFLQVAFDTGSLYGELGFRDDMARALSEDLYIVTDTVLVYNQEGLLVNQLGMESSTLGAQTFELEDAKPGAYTLVMWQTVRMVSNNVVAWKLEHRDTLSKVSISSHGGSFRCYWALGTASAKVTLGDKPVKVDMTPKAEGSILDVTIDGYTEDLGYKSIWLKGGQWHSGIYLDPAIQNDAKYIVDANKIGSLFSLSYAEGGHEKYFTIHNGKDISMEFRGYDSDTHYHYYRDIPHQTVETGKNYTVYWNLPRRKWQPPFFGSAEEFASWKADRDAGWLVFDPVLNWGCSISDVKEIVHSRNWWKDCDEKPQPVNDYWVESFKVSPSMEEQYAFNTEEGNDLALVVCVCNDSGLSIDAAYSLVEMQGYHLAGKIVFPEEEPHDIFFSEDNATEVYIDSQSNGGWFIVYQPTDPEDLQYIVKTEAIDLGLSVKWASCNLGAASPEEPGDFFAWGEVAPYYSSLDPLTWKEGKEAGYDWPSYRWCDGTDEGITKYFDQDSNLLALDPEDDAAHVILGGSWRMPTRSEIKELLDTQKNENYKWEYKNLNGNNGWSITYLTNNNSIFLPNTGMWRGTAPKDNEGENTFYTNSGFYWSPSLVTGGLLCDAIYFVTTENFVALNVMLRSDGLAIRAVTE